MALIKCPKCGKEFSDRAKACPQCGTSTLQVEWLIKEQKAKEAEQERLRKEREAEEARIRAEKRAAWWAANKKKVIALVLVLIALFGGYVVYLNVTPITARNGEELRSALQNPLRFSKDSIKVVIPRGDINIGTEAFAYCTNLTSIEIPNSVTNIGKNAFCGCSSLTAIELPNSVTTIEMGAFRGCTGLANVIIPNNVTCIGESAFEGCSGLKSIEIPNSVTNIGKAAFKKCDNLTSVTIPNSITSIGYDAFSGVLNIIYEGPYDEPWGARNVNGYVEGYMVYRDKSKKELLACSPAITGDVVIPQGVTSIGDYAFKNCTSLTSIEIPNSATSIGNYVFLGCKGLTSITIPNSVTSVGWDIFDECSNLTSPIYNARLFVHMPISYSGTYIIPDGIKTIVRSAFLGCKGITSVTIPNSVTSIEEVAFCQCTGLTSLTIPNSVTSIGISAFYNCQKLKLKVPQQLCEEIEDYDCKEVIYY